MGSKRWKRNRRLKCTCGGYHFPHRRTGGACHYGVRSEYYLAIRAGASKPDAEALLWAHTLETLP